MEFEKFIEVVREIVAEKSGKRVEIKVINKNNNIKLHGLAIFEECSNISPTIYLEQFWEMYEKTGCMNIIIDKIMNMYTRGRIDNIDMEWITCWETVKSKIAYKFVNYEANKEMLQTVPHTKFLDLAKTYYIIFENDDVGEGTINIHNNFIDMWGVTVEELDGVATVNTPQKYPMQMITFQEILCEKGFDVECEECGGCNKDFVVLTNENKCFGAATMCYENVLKSIADSKESDVIIIPCSVHECLIGRMVPVEELKYIKELVKGANADCVLPEERLSDCVYVYRRETDTIEFA